MERREGSPRQQKVYARREAPSALKAMRFQCVLRDFSLAAESLLEVTAFGVAAQLQTFDVTAYLRRGVSHSLFKFVSCLLSFLEFFILSRTGVVQQLIKEKESKPSYPAR